MAAGGLTLFLLLLSVTAGIEQVSAARRRPVVINDNLIRIALKRANKEGGKCPRDGSTCDSDYCGVGLESVFHVEETGDWRILVSNGIPDHSYSIGAEQANRNPVCIHNVYLKVPKNPTLGTFQVSGMGPVGVALSGAFFYNHLSSPDGEVAVENEKLSFDSCSGHADGRCSYHYHKVPNCLDPDDSCKLVGYMRDGFPVYSYCDVDGVRLKSCYKLTSGDGTHQDHYDFLPDSNCHLDEANGYDFGDSIGYGYVFSENYPFIMRGYMGSVVYDFCKVQ